MRRTSFLTLLILLVLFTLKVEANEQRLLQTTTYVTNSDRGYTVSDHCNSKVNRLELYSSYGLSGDIPEGGTVSGTFKMDTSFIGDAAGGDWGKFGQKIKNNAGKMFVFVGAWVIGLVVALILFPFLLCCCICPWSCPIWNRKRENMPYTRCEQIWPAIASLVLLLIILITSIVGIASHFKAKANYDEVACASGVVIDDVINGNVSFTDSSNYFSGVRTVYNQLYQMNQNIIQLNVQIAKLSSVSTGVTDAKSKISTAKTSTAQVPSLLNSSLSLTYNTPLQNTPGTTTSTINSLLPDALGNKSAPASLVGASYLTLTTYEDIINIVSSAADTYTVNSPIFTASIQLALSEIDKSATDLQLKDKQADDFFSKNKSAFNGISIGEYVYYGVLIGLSVLMIIVVSCTAWGESAGCRQFMYSICVLLFLFCIIAFLFCIFVSVINPMLYYTCQYVQQNLNSKATLNETLVIKFKMDKEVAGNISQCIAIDGSGDIVRDIIGKDVYRSIDSLNSTYTNLTNIDTTLINVIATIHTSMRDNITAVKKAQIVDITDQNALAQLINLSKAASYTCDSPGFTQDSWIPSISQIVSYAPCQVNGSNSDSTTCTSSANFNTRTTGCTGCMDTFDLFQNNGTFVDVNNALTARYPSLACTTFNSQLSNVWGNFYKQKINVLNPVQSRASTAKTNADNVVSTGNYFTTVKQNIDNQFSAVVNAQYGILNGLRCQTVSEDVRLAKNVVCNGLFLYTYFTRVIFGILSFALLFLMCCITCTGHRNCKSMESGNHKYDDDDHLESNPNMPQYNMASQQQFNYGQKNPYLQNNTNNYPTYV